MKSPFTGGEVTLKQEKREFVYRKEKFSIINHYYVCNDTGEDFTTTKLDELNIGQVYNQYRVKYGIPFPDEIIAIREQYGLSATKMSQILGFGDNQYRLYEAGEMPSESNGKQIASIQDCTVFRSLVERSKNQFTKSELNRIESKIECLTVPDLEEIFYHRSLFGNHERSATNGFAAQSVKKLINMILFFIRKSNGIFPAKLNKLLFYSDFLNFKISGIGISGLTYRAIQYGPVPTNYAQAYASIEQIDKEEILFSKGVGEKLVATVDCDETIFSDQELTVLNTVYKQFSSCNTDKVSGLSHKESAWIKNNGDRNIINYFDAFDLKGIDIPEIE